jgi:Fibronectin type III domain
VRLSISHFYPQVSALLVLAASLAGSCVTAFAGEVGVAWDARTEPEIVGYKIYYQGITHSDLRRIDVGNVTTYRVTGLDPDTYYFCVTAYDNPGNETACSNVVSITLSPPMYGFREKSALSRNHRSSRSAQKELFASSFHPVACRLQDGDRVLTRAPDSRINIHSQTCIVSHSIKPPTRFSGFTSWTIPCHCESIPALEGWTAEGPLLASDAERVPWS